MAKAMRVYYDTEFLEDGHTVDLISIGMVREDGAEYYAVSSEFNTYNVANNAWLMENVMSSIGHESYIVYMTAFGAPRVDLRITDPAAKTRQQMRDEIMQFCEGVWPSFVAWYGAYDHVALCQLFGRMIDLPSKFPMFTYDLKQLHKELGSPKMPEQPVGKHNALDDARFNIVRHRWLLEYKDDQNL